MKQLCTLAPGAQFIFAGQTWTKLDEMDGATVCITSEIIECRAFDEGNCNDWRKSTLRAYLNDVPGGFLGALGCNNSDNYDPFCDVISDLTADDGMKDYDVSIDKIALLSCDQYRRFRDLIPPVEEWWWTITPWSCRPDYSCNVRNVNSSGALNSNNAYHGGRGVRPLCNLKSEIFVSVPGEADDEAQAAAREAEIHAAADYMLDALNAVAPSDYGAVLGLVIDGIMKIKADAEDMTAEAAAIRAENGG